MPVKFKTSIRFVLNESIKQGLFNVFKKDAWMYNGDVRSTAVLESYGVPDCMEKYIDVFKEELYNHRDDDEFVLTDNVFSNIEGCFFNDIHIVVTTVSLANKRNIERANGGDMTKEHTQISPFKICDNGKADVFDAWFVLPDTEYVEEYIESALDRFYHEFLHFYEDYCRLRTGKLTIHDDAGFSKYSKVVRRRSERDNSKLISTYKTKLGTVLYFLTGFEVRAMTASVHNDIDKYIDVVRRPMLLYKVIEQTPSYKRFVDVGDIIGELISSPHMSVFIEEAWFKLTDEKLTYKKIMKILKNRYDKVWRKFRTIVCKAVYDKAMNHKPAPLYNLSDEISDVKDLSVVDIEKEMKDYVKYGGIYKNTKRNALNN